MPTRILLVIGALALVALAITALLVARAEQSANSTIAAAEAAAKHDQASARKLTVKIREREGEQRQVERKLAKAERASARLGGIQRENSRLRKMNDRLRNKLRNRYVKVPEIEGKDQAEAEEILNTLGLYFDSVEAAFTCNDFSGHYDDRGYGENIVSDQSPHKGTLLPRDGTVYFTMPPPEINRESCFESADQ